MVKNKEKNDKKFTPKFKSVRVKLFYSLSAVIVCIITLLILMNSIILEAFYVYSKVNKVKEAYDNVNKLYSSHPSDLYERLKDEAAENGFEILVETQDNIISFASNENIVNIIDENQDIAHFTQSKKDRTNGNVAIIYGENNLIIKKISTNGLNCILLSGELDNGYKIYIQVPFASIQESVKISNNLLLIMGVIAIFIAGIVASFISRRFTKPIVQLNNIANKMSKLDFQEKYRLSDTEDEINELGNSINIMSDKLETTINQLRSSNSELERNIEEKSKIDEMRKQFISDVSHELKTPIALIQGYAEGLIENVNVDPESRKYYAEVILDESNKMDRLVKQLLELMKLEYGKRDFSNEKFDICELIREVIRKCNVMIEEKHSKIIFEEKEPIYVYADSFYIDQTFTNYITNAIKHVKEINGTNEIEIKLTINKKKNNVRISVYNTGATIPEEDLDKVWGRFYKVDESRNRQDGGSGIGLSLVKAVMNNYKQAYGVTNKQDGVEFYFDLELFKEQNNK